MHIFISYRRDDLAARSIVGRIHERLTKRYGASSVFVDEHAVPPGSDFRDVIRQRLASCDVVFALVGPQWEELIRSRAAEPEDYLLLELKTALDSNIPVIPILLSGALMPSASVIPPEIKRFSYLNARSIDPGPDFNHQLDRLISDLDRSQPATHRRKALLIGGAMVLAVAAPLAIWWNFRPASKRPRQISVVPIMGENVDYEKEIRDAFLKKLGEDLGARNAKLVSHREIAPVFESGYASPASDMGKTPGPMLFPELKLRFPKAKSTTS